MVTRYDVIWLKSCKVLIYVLFFMSSTPFLAVLTWFLILGEIQDGGRDDDHCWWRHGPPAAPPLIKYTSSCREDQKLSTEGTIVLKYCNISKTLGGGVHSPPLYDCGGMNWRVRPRVNVEYLDYQPEGQRFNSCWKNSEFSTRLAGVTNQKRKFFV